jgi:cis-L-3-hydroxyproline dehydratase
MKITQIDLFQVTYNLLDRSYAWSGGKSVSTFLSSIVKISTDEGIAGFGEVCPLGSAYIESYAGGVPAGVRELGKALIGLDPRQVHVANSVMDRTLNGHLYVKSPLDIACWDIFGRSVGLPITALIGGAFVGDYPLYRAISQRTPGEMAADVEKYRSEGYRRFQLKVGGDPDEDVRRVEHVLKVLSPGDVLVADANTGWRVHQAVRVANGLRGKDVYLEAPCLSYEECLVVRRNTPLPFILDEHITGIHQFLRAREDGCMDVVNIKISRLGGLTKAVQLRDLCVSTGIAMTLEDSWGGDVATATIGHMVGSTPEAFLFTSTDFNSYNDLHVAPDAPRRVEGRIRVPSGPGLGITVDEKALGEPVVTVRK